MRSLAVDSRYDWGWNRLPADVVYGDISSHFYGTATREDTDVPAGYPSVFGAVAISSSVGNTYPPPSSLGGVVSLGQTWTAMVWVMGSGTAHVSLDEHTDNDGYLGAHLSSTVALDGDPQPLRVTATLTYVGVTKLTATLQVVSGECTAWQFGLGMGNKDPAFWTPPPK